MTQKTHRYELFAIVWVEASEVMGMKFAAGYDQRSIACIKASSRKQAEKIGKQIAEAMGATESCIL